MGALDQAPRIIVAAVRLFEREVTFHMPFRFGVITATGGQQAFAAISPVNQSTKRQPAGAI